MATPTCFISYSWDSDAHRDWVRYLSDALCNNGVDTRLDQYDVFPGMDLTLYMETCVRESTFVLLVCTPTFAEKANKGQGGVGFERMIVTGEIFGGEASPKKFVPVLRSGEAKESLPSYLRSRLFLDFRDDAKFQASLEQLLRHLYESPKY
ncbi:MAG: toll/interleukin-1 receptor domain-containing protein [Acidobacteriota bacterium]